jgi:hypothetical protein
MNKKFFANILVLNFIRTNRIHSMSTMQNKQQLKIDITSDNICRMLNEIEFK